MTQTRTRKLKWSVKTNNEHPCSAADHTNTPSQLTTKCMHTAHVNLFIALTTHQNHRLKIKRYQLRSKKPKKPPATGTRLQNRNEGFVR